MAGLDSLSTLQRYKESPEQVLPASKPMTGLDVSQAAVENWLYS